MFKIFKKKEKPWYEKGGYPKPIKPKKLDKPWKPPAEQSVPDPHSSKSAKQ